MRIYIDLDDTLCQYTKAKLEALKKNPKMSYPQSQYGFFANLEPMPNYQVVQYLFDHYPQLDIYFLTAPSLPNPMSYAEKRVWIEKYFSEGLVERLVLCNNKGLMKGDILIDDCVEGRGQENFEGELIQFGSEKFPDWLTIERYILKEKL